ncbi:anaerobic ribonucleoside-triphosphate reductase activating protein [Candidatus Woesearchaeota archaeon]|nr:anaerobic ribonucleoside-triphosphate reductase activating protein [Candidatus Woesearchaeota archaeon]
MNIGGFQKISLKDYQGNVSSIIYSLGCNFKCGYCHNPDLLNNKSKFSEEEILDFLNQRKDMLDAVVITGGEPTIHHDLKDFLEKIKELDLKIKLYTNGSTPDVVKDLLNSRLIDAVSMDYKCPLDSYHSFVDFSDVEKVKETRDFLIEYDGDYEFRITLVEELFNDGILEQIAKELKSAKKIILQKFRNDIVLDKEFEKYKNTSDKYMIYAKETMEKIVDKKIYIS